MSDTLQNTRTCSSLAAYRFTWPGKDESWICKDHAEALKQVAVAIGLHIQLIPYSGKNLCAQKLSGENDE